MQTDHLINNDYPFLKGGGEMGGLMRATDWSATPLGNPGKWPQSLKTTISIILNSKFPMFLYWGPELICFYNDAYRPSLGQNGKHPSIFGMPAILAWPEIWDIIKPLIDKVLTQSEASWSEDQLIPIYRNGQLEDVYWTFSYSPVTDESGKPAGVFVTCSETTGKVMASRLLEETNNQLKVAIETDRLAQKKLVENENNLRLIILQAPVSIAIFRGPEYVVEIANPLALELWGHKLAHVLNKPILDAMPELINQGIKKLLDHVYDTGTPFSATELPVELLRNGHLEKAYINFVYEPLYDSTGVINGLITIGTDVTAQVLDRKQLEESAAELQSINEKMTASNEELLSTNEELAETQKNLRIFISRLFESEEKLRQAIQTGGMGTWTINPETMTIIISDFIKDLLGLPLDQQPQLKDILQAIEPDYHQTVTDVLRGAIKNSQNSDTEYPVKNLITGELKWVRATGKMFFDSQGVATEYSGILMDITERKLDDLRKNDFIGMVSHELKTPLTSLTAIVQVLNVKLKKSEDNFIAGALDKANVQVKKMASMINGFLNISRLESGKILVTKEHFNIKLLVEEVIDEIKLTALSHIITLVPGEPVIVFADRDKIGSVISNLLSNAVKYSPKGKRIEVQCIQVDDDVQVSVTDEGMGIKSQHLDKLFDRYYRVETNHTRHISGFGIGLYLSSEIIRRHDGKIWVESESGEGSTFYFSLPLTKPEEV